MEQDTATRTGPPPQSTRRRLATWVLYFFVAQVAAFETISLNSLFVGHPAIGALQGFCLVGIAVSVAAWWLAPEQSRHRFLARLLTMLSAISLLSLIVLQGKVNTLQATGAFTARVAFTPTLIALLFQLGFAAAYLWRSNRQPPRPRDGGGPAVPWWTWGPAALFIPILLVAGLVGHTQFEWGAADPAESTPNEPPHEKYVRSPKPADFEFAQETYRVGKDFGGDFAHYHTGRLPLLGFAYSNRDWQRQVRVSNDFRGIFDRDTPIEGDHTIVARPGYVVAGLQAQVDEHVHTFRVRFARLGEWGLERVDTYWSDWSSPFQPGLPVTELDGKGELVLGVTGSSGLVVNSLGLMVEPSDP